MANLTDNGMLRVPRLIRCRHIHGSSSAHIQEFRRQETFPQKRRNTHKKYLRTSWFTHYVKYHPFWGSPSLRFTRWTKKNIHYRNSDCELPDHKTSVRKLNWRKRERHTMDCTSKLYPIILCKIGKYDSHDIITLSSLLRFMNASSPRCNVTTTQDQGREKYHVQLWTLMGFVLPIHLFQTYITHGYSKSVYPIDSWECNKKEVKLHCSLQGLSRETTRLSF